MLSLLFNVIEDVFGELKASNEDSGQLSVNCPLCDDGRDKGNLEINVQRGVFKCWSCQDTNRMSGSIIRLLKRFGTPKNIHDYLLVKPDADLIQAKEHPDIVLTLPEGYKKLSSCTSNDFKSDIALKYLKERGITDDIIKEFEIGYTYKGKYFNRIIIPSYDATGKLNYFIARWFDKKYTKLKYLNPEVEKQKIIFNEGKINWDATIYLVEGVTDHIVVPNSIPMLGKHISEDLLDKIYEKAASYIVVLLDGDACEDAKILYNKLNFGKLHGRIRICRPPDDYDPSKIFEKVGNKGIVKLLMCSRELSPTECY